MSETLYRDAQGRAFIIRDGRQVWVEEPPHPRKARGGGFGVFLVLALVAFMVGAFVFGGGTKGGARQGRFEGYETRDTGIKATSPIPESNNGLFANRTVRERTGYAYVRLDGGSRIKASCQMEGLAEGARVDVRQSGDGEWAVVVK